MSDVAARPASAAVGRPQENGDETPLALLDVASEVVAPSCDAAQDKPVKVSDRTVTADLLARLQRHYIKPGTDLPGGIFVTEVGWNATGTTRCDAIFVGFTGTSGRMMVGHEAKASRSDWLNELSKPGKADAWADECHAWYVVAPSTAVVKPEELPLGWGLLLPGTSRTRMTIKVHAKVHRDRAPSWDACRSVMARYDTLRADAIFQAKQKASDEARENVEEQVCNRVAQATGTDRLERALKQRDQIIAALGVAEVRYGVGPSYGDDSISLSEIRAAATFLRAHRDLGQAVDELCGRYGLRTEDITRRVESLSSALQALRSLAPTKDGRAVS
jgi:hypothetical protein